MNDTTIEISSATSLSTEEKKENLMKYFDDIQNLNRKCNPKQIDKLKVLSQTYTELNNLKSLETVTSNDLKNLEFKYKFREELISAFLKSDKIFTCYREDYVFLLFLYSVTFDEELKNLFNNNIKIKSNYMEIINQTINFDSVILFVVKYGNIYNKNFLEYIKFLIEIGVDVNNFDFNGRMLIDFFPGLLERNPNLFESLQDLIKCFTDKIVQPVKEETKKFFQDKLMINLNQFEFKSMDDETQLFYTVCTYRIKEIRTEKGNDKEKEKNKGKKNFLEGKNIKPFVNSRKKEYTLLQLCIKKFDNPEIVKALLNEGADPTLTTDRNPFTPLELAAKYNRCEVLMELLRNEKIKKISQKEFTRFVQWRKELMKPKTFNIILESKKLDIDLVHEKTGNTPLYYAIYFANKKGIQILLKRGSSLITKNEFQNSPLDVISLEDLEEFFDSCLVFDNYSQYFDDVNHKMLLRFDSLIEKSCNEEKRCSEVKVISRIGNQPNLEPLLTHPLIHAFIFLKWFKIQIFFWFTIFFQGIIFLLLSVFIYNLPYYSTSKVFCISLTLLNMFIKLPIFLFFKKRNKLPFFYALKRASLHSTVEILIIISIFGSFFQNSFRAFVFIEMAIAFLLTAGYHPKLSKWSLMLQKVFKTFTILLIFFSLIVLAFGVGFTILFPNNDMLKSFFPGSIFWTFIMINGEYIAADEMDFEASGFGGYLLFMLFALSLCLVIVNFWTGVAVTDIERIEKKAEINAFKNVIIFMRFVDFIYNSRVRKFIPSTISPLIFGDANMAVREKGYKKVDDGFTLKKSYDVSKKKNLYCVDFFVNKNDQFNKKPGYPSKLDTDCLIKIRLRYDKRNQESTHQQLMKKLEEITIMLKQKQE